MNELIQATQTIIDQETVLKLIAAQEVFLGPWKTNLWRQAIDGIIDYTTGQRVIGWCDGHVHLDRVFTFEADFFPTGTPVSETADLPLPLKQDFIGGLHNGPAYSEESLKSRMEHQIKRAVTFGTRELWAITDTTPDIKLRAFNIALSLKEQYKDKIHIFVGSYPVFGFKNPEVNPDRLDCLISTMGKADFIVGLPEKDEEPTRIGFKGHVNLLLELGFKHQKEVHIHADQANTAHSNDSLRVIECLEGLVPEKLNWYIAPKQSPKLWLVHVISPSSYAPEKFTRLVRLLVKYNI
ncbi:MAG: hypothetical protein NT091_03555, partial [Candidatus Falkowbacteria bacterium]|nr:hypothetical protein [Candidatus Falkowbacteria bacterium]